MRKTIEQLIPDLTSHGGAVVRSSECSPMELAWAEDEERLYVDGNGYGYVRRPGAWLAHVKAMQDGGTPGYPPPGTEPAPKRSKA